MTWNRLRPRILSALAILPLAGLPIAATLGCDDGGDEAFEELGDEADDAADEIEDEFDDNT